jgi:signal transduction histidine kinase
MPWLADGSDTDVVKIPKVGIAIAILFIVAITLSAQILIRQEAKKNIQDITDKGTYLVNLVSLYPFKDFAPKERGYFLRTLTEYTLNQGLLYLFVHDRAGLKYVSLVPPEIASRIPDDAQTEALSASTLVQRTYSPSGLPFTVYEFAKPIFEGGKKVGTVRLGLRLPSITVFAMERVSLLAMIAFFITAALLVAYYGIAMTLKSLKLRYTKTLEPDPDGSSHGLDSVPVNRERIIPFFEDVERSLDYVDHRLREMKEDNLKLLSKLGASSFEKNQLTNVLDSMSFGIILADLQDNITLMNDYMLKLIQDKRENVIGKTLGHVFQQKEILEFISHNEIAGSNGGMNFIETSFAERAPGQIFQVSVTHLKSGQRTAIGKVILVKNVTSTTLAKKAQQEFIAHVAHELATPLTNVRAYTEMLMDGEVENPEMEKEFYNTINQETHRLANLVQNLLSVSRMEMGNLTLNKGLVRADWLVNDCMTTIEASAQSKNIAIEKHLPDTLPSFIGDKELLKTAIINVLGNAVKYTQEKGKIMFSVEERGNTLMFEVADTGCGMSQDDLPHIFEKFYRSANPEVTAKTGSGLGLAIAYEIVRLHEGDIEVQSRLGEGSRFTIKMPKEEYVIGRQ